MTVEVNQGVAWIIGLLAAVPILRQAFLFAREIMRAIRGKERTPPLAEEVAHTYVKRAECEHWRQKCEATIDLIRAEITATDRKAEERAIGTHKRLDKFGNAVGKMSRSMGIMIGIQIASTGGNSRKARELINQTAETEIDTDD